MYGFKTINPYKPKYAVGDKVRITKEKRVFKKGYLPNFTEEIFIVSEILKTAPYTYKLKNLNGEEIKGSFHEPEMVKHNKEDEIYKIEKIIKRKGNKLFVKWLGYPGSFKQLDRQERYYLICSSSSNSFSYILN